MWCAGCSVHCCACAALLCCIAEVPHAAFKHKLVQEYPALQLNGWKVRLQLFTVALALLMLPLAVQLQAQDVCLNAVVVAASSILVLRQGMFPQH